MLLGPCLSLQWLCAQFRRARLVFRKKAKRAPADRQRYTLEKETQRGRETNSHGVLAWESAFRPEGGLPAFLTPPHPHHPSLQTTTHTTLAYRLRNPSWSPRTHNTQRRTACFSDKSLTPHTAHPAPRRHPEALTKAAPIPEKRRHTEITGLCLIIDNKPYSCT